MLIWEVSESLETKAGQVTYKFAKNQVPLLQNSFHHPSLVSSAALWGSSFGVLVMCLLKQESTWERDQGLCRWGLRRHVLCKPSDRAWHRFRAGDGSDILMLNDITL